MNLTNKVRFALGSDRIKRGSAQITAAVETTRRSTPESAAGFLLLHITENQLQLEVFCRRGRSERESARKG